MYYLALAGTRLAIVCRACHTRDSADVWFLAAARRLALIGEGAVVKIAEAIAQVTARTRDASQQTVRLSGSRNFGVFVVLVGAPDDVGEYGVEGLELAHVHSEFVHDRWRDG